MKGAHMFVFFDNKMLPIDSLYKYNIKDFASISVELNKRQDI